MRAQRLEIIPIEGMPLVKQLDDLSELILTILHFPMNSRHLRPPEIVSVNNEVKMLEGKALSVEVKSARTKSICQLKKPPVPDNPEDLFWTFVSLVEAQPVYCIIRSDEVRRLWHEYNDQFPADDKYQGIKWRTLREYQDQWDALPGLNP